MFSFLFVLPIFVASWKENFLFRREILVENDQNFEIVNANFSIIVNTAKLINEGLLSPLCVDLIFMLDDSETLLDFWLESGCGLNYTSFWITLPRIGANETITVYMYSGNEEEMTDSYSLEWNSDFAFFSKSLCSGEYFPLYPEEHVLLKGGSYQNLSVGGSLVHYHDVTIETETASPFVNDHGDNIGAEFVAWKGHKHELQIPDAVMGTLANENKYENMPSGILYILCVGNSSETIFHPGFLSNVIAFFDDEVEAISSGWVSENELNNLEYYPITTSSSDDLLSHIGQNNHTHTYNDSSWEFVGDFSNPSDEPDPPPIVKGTGDEFANPLSHDHIVVSTSSTISPNDPFHLFLNARNTPSSSELNNVIPVSGMITPIYCSKMIGNNCMVPPIGYLRYSPLDGNYIRSTDNFTLVGTTGGSVSHTHDVSGECESPSEDVRNDDGLWDGDLADHLHTHQFTGETDPSDSDPPHIQLMFVKRVESDLKVNNETTDSLLSCYGLFPSLNDTMMVCSGHGKCERPNLCVCESSYYGDHCNITHWKCLNISRNSSEVCSRHGDCLVNGSCICKDGYTHPTSGGDLDCSSWRCYGIDQNDSAVCGGHGECISPNICECSENYTYVADCSLYQCFGSFNNESLSVCSTHGDCLSHDYCECDEGYTERSCGQYSCYNISRLETDEVCSGHGDCLDFDDCDCDPGYEDTDICDRWRCGGIWMDDDNVCSGHGTCDIPGVCKPCEDGYHGDECELWNCDELMYEDNVCSGNGDCIEPDTCECKNGYTGKTCRTNAVLAGVLTPGLVLPTLACLICLLYVVFFSIGFAVCLFLSLCIGSSLAFCGFYEQRRKVMRFSKLEGVDLLMAEQNTGMSEAKIKINKELFEIQYDEVRTERLLGKGGSEASVFLALWKDQKVAFKCFKTQRLMSDEHEFGEFEREVKIMSSLAHPNIIRFFGATLKPPRVGILMEYCSKGELFEFLERYRKRKGKMYPINEKMRMCGEIVSALDYIHSRNVVHRDLKCENVLVDGHYHCKLMDFGLSKVFKGAAKNTKAIGTSVYMAPEVTLGEEYNERCDVYSFSILLWIVITEDDHPYGKNNNFRVEFRVASNRDFRPSMSKLKESLKDQDLRNMNSVEWIEYICKRCWDHNPRYRLDISQLSILFREHLENIDHTKDLGENYVKVEEQEYNSEEEQEQESSSEEEEGEGEEGEVRKKKKKKKKKKSKKLSQMNPKDLHMEMREIVRLEKVVEEFRRKTMDLELQNNQLRSRTSGFNIMQKMIKEQQNDLKEQKIRFQKMEESYKKKMGEFKDAIRMTVEDQVKKREVQDMNMKNLSQSLRGLKNNMMEKETENVGLKKAIEMVIEDQKNKEIGEQQKITRILEELERLKKENQRQREEIEILKKKKDDNNDINRRNEEDGDGFDEF